MKRIFSYANKSHFHNKGFIFSLVLKVEIFWKSEMDLKGVRKTQTRGPGWGLSFFFKECCFRIRVRVSVNPNPHPNPQRVFSSVPTFVLVDVNQPLPWFFTRWPREDSFSVS